MATTTHVKSNRSFFFSLTVFLIISFLTRYLFVFLLLSLTNDLELFPLFFQAPFILASFVIFSIAGVLFTLLTEKNKLIYPPVLVFFVTLTIYLIQSPPISRLVLSSSLISSFENFLATVIASLVSSFIIARNKQ